MMGELLTVVQAADRLQVRPMTVYRWIWAGKLNVKRLPGGGLRIEPEQLESLLTEQKGGSHAKRRK